MRSAGVRRGEPYLCDISCRGLVIRDECMPKFHGIVGFAKFCSCLTALSPEHVCVCLLCVMLQAGFTNDDYKVFLQISSDITSTKR